MATAIPHGSPPCFVPAWLETATIGVRDLGAAGVCESWAFQEGNSGKGASKLEPYSAVAACFPGVFLKTDVNDTLSC